MTRLSTSRPVSQRRVTHSGLVADRLALAPALAWTRPRPAPTATAPSDFNATQAAVRAWLTALAGERCEAVTRRCVAATRDVPHAGGRAGGDIAALLGEVSRWRAKAEAASRALLAVLARRDAKACIDRRDGDDADAAAPVERDSEVFALIYDYAIAHERFSRLRATYARETTL